MKMLLGIDGSSAAQAAIDLVAGLDWPAGSHVRIVEAVDTRTDVQPWPALAYAPPRDLEADFIRGAETSLRAAAQSFAGTSLLAETALLRGRPADVLLAEARRTGVDLIVVGSRGHGTLEAMLLGSVSAEIVSRSRVPVLVVRSATVGRAVLAWDRSPAAQAAVELLETWPMFRGASVEVASVVDVGPWWASVPPLVPAEALNLFEAAAEEARGQAEASVRELCGRLRRAGIAASEGVFEGDPGATLVQVARDSKADLVVMGTHGRHGVTGFVLGSVARTLVLHAPASVLVVPTPLVEASANGHPAAASSSR